MNARSLSRQTVEDALLEITINVDGEILPAREAAVPAMDHGFLYGDSVYETFRTYRGRPFLLGRHLDRLQRSLDRLFLTLPLSRREIEEEIHRTLAAQAEAAAAAAAPADSPRDAAVRLVVSRGVGPIGLDITACVSPRYLIYVFPIPARLDSFHTDGIAVVISRTRRNHPRALDPAIKSGNFLNNILAYRDAREAGAHEAILLGADGYLAEGTTSNIFLVRDGAVWTPAACGILDGITRAVVIEEAAAAGIAVNETNIPAEALFSASEAFITSSVRGIVPATRVNGLPIGSGKPGEITRRLMGLYEARMERECR